METDMKTITADMLSEHNACTEQYELFCRTWPKGCKVTLKDCKKAVRLGFNIDWAVQHLLGKAELEAYNEAFATAWKAFYEAVAPELKAYHEATAPAHKAFAKAKAYDEAFAPVRKAYREAKAIAFYEVWHRA